MQSITLTNLAVADGLMGVYLITLGDRVKNIVFPYQGSTQVNIECECHPVLLQEVPRDLTQT